MAIVVTALGTCQTKGTAVGVDVHTLSVGDLIIIVTAGDQNYSDPAVLNSSYTFIRWVGSCDVEAVNTGSVELGIWRYAIQLGDYYIGYTPGVTAAALTVYKVTGLAASPLDKTKTAVNTSATPSSTDTVATTQAAELLIGGIGTEGPDGDLPGTWNGDTTENNQRLGTTGAGAASNITVAAATKIVAATGTYSADKTGITSRDWAAAIATYKAAVAATSDPGVFSAITRMINRNTLLRR